MACGKRTTAKPSKKKYNYSFQVGRDGKSFRRSSVLATSFTDAIAALKKKHKLRGSFTLNNYEYDNTVRQKNYWTRSARPDKVIRLYIEEKTI